MVDKKEFYLNVVKLMKEKQITTSKLAIKARINPSSASRFLRGKSENASLDYIIDLCGIVGITVNLSAYVVAENEL